MQGSEQEKISLALPSQPSGSVTSEMKINDIESNYMNLADKVEGSSSLNSMSFDNFSSLNTEQQRDENEKCLQKYEADIRNHISIE